MSPLYRRVVSYFLPHWWPTLMASLLTVIQTPFNLLKPWPLAFLVAEVLPAIGKPVHGLALTFGKYHYALTDWTLPQIVAACSISVVVFHVISAWLHVVSQMMYYRVGLQGLLDLRTDLYSYLHSLPLKYHDARRSGDSTFRVAYDSQSLQAFYSKAIFLFQSAKDLASILVTMWALDVQVTLLSLSVIPVMVFTFRMFATKVRDQSTRIAERESAVLSLAQEGLSSVKMVQAFGREEDEVKQFSISAQQSLDENMRMQHISMSSSMIVATLLMGGTAAL